ncbi:MAG: HAMP domain-containing protein [Acidimicrobiales bacterium]
MKLALAVGIPVVASLLFALLALRTLEQVRIGGAQYDEVAQSNDLRADILPPPYYIVESYLTAQLMAETTDDAAFQDLKAQMGQHELDYQGAHERWIAELKPTDPGEAEVARLLNEDAYESANDFYAKVKSDFYPAVEADIRGDSTDAGHDVLEEVLLPLYLQHRASVVDAVPLVERQTSALERDATRSAQRGYSLLLLALVALTLIALLLAALVVRAIVRPINRLTRAADEVARTLETADLEQEAPALPPIELDASRELNLAADSFNTLIDTTTDLLDRHARTRRNLGEIFQNLGRRNHGLLTRSLQVITELEQSETDSATLDRLFRLDHLATRMRRNAENLLVLAGSQSARPVERQSSMHDIIRSALSEIEAYTRVDRPELEPVAVKAGAVADVTHLLAELLENATNFSPPDTRVRVLGDFVDDGYAVTVIDEGLGMREDAIAEANQRIQRLASLDLTPTRTLGLYVVGRLAHRHGIRVRLLEGTLRGTVAKVVLPMSLLAEADPSPAELELQRARYERVLESAIPGGSGRTRRGTPMAGPVPAGVATVSPAANPPMPTAVPVAGIDDRFDDGPAGGFVHRGPLRPAADGDVQVDGMSSRTVNRPPSVVAPPTRPSPPPFSRPPTAIPSAMPPSPPATVPPPGGSLPSAVPPVPGAPAPSGPAPGSPTGDRRAERPPVAGPAPIPPSSLLSGAGGPRVPPASPVDGPPAGGAGVAVTGHTGNGSATDAAYAGNGNGSGHPGNGFTGNGSIDNGYTGNGSIDNGYTGNGQTGNGHGYGGAAADTGSAGPNGQGIGSTDSTDPTGNGLGSPGNGWAGGEPAPGAAPAAGQETRGGMRRRVRGAQMPETSLTAGLGPNPDQTSEAAGPRGEQLDRQRDSLRAFQHGVDQGARDGRQVDDEGDHQP